EADAALPIAEAEPTRFEGYDKLHARSQVLALYHEGRQVTELPQGAAGVVLLQNTAFYGEGGGQVGDQGQLLGEGLVFSVEDTRRQGGHFLHIGKVLEGTLRTGTELRAEVAAGLRHATMLNHSA